MKNNNTLVPIPLTEKFFNNQTNDLLYTYLLLNSDKTKTDNKKEIINSPRFSLRQISNAIYGNEKYKDKVSRDLKKLQDAGLIEFSYSEEKMMGLKIVDLLSHSPCALISPSALSFLISLGEKNIIKIYSYLLYKRETSNNKDYLFNVDDLLLNCLQYSSSTQTKNRQKVHAIISLLNIYSFIEIEKVKLPSRTTPMTKYSLKNINNYYTEVNQTMNNIDIKLSIPLTENFLNNKTNDLLYAYLLAKSFYDQNENMRYLFRDQVDYKDVIKQIENINNTKKVQRDLNYLEEIELIDRHYICDKYGKDKQIIEILENNFGFFVAFPIETIKYMVHAFSKDSIKIYAYLYNKEEYFFAKYNRHYEFSISELITECLKMNSTDNRSLYQRIEDILGNLQANELLEIKKITKRNKEGYPYSMRRITKTSKTPKGYLIAKENYPKRKKQS